MITVLTRYEIQDAVQKCINAVKEAQRHPIVLHVIMNGAFMFATDFLKYYDGDIHMVTFPRADRGYSEGNVHEPVITGLRGTDGKSHLHVLLDVVSETGRTLQEMKRRLIGLGEHNILTCALIWKLPSDPKTEVVYVPDVYGFHNPKGLFLTGYGMGPYRWLPEVQGS